MLNTLESDPDAELPGKASEDTQGGGLGSALADGAAGSPSPTHFGEALRHGRTRNPAESTRACHSAPQPHG